MSNTQLALYRPPDNSKVYVARKLKLLRSNTIASIVLVLLLGGLYILGNGDLALPLAPFFIAGILIVICNNPEILLPFTIACVCLIEVYQYNFTDSVTDKVPLFWDINTIVQQYTPAKNFHGAPITLYEVFFIVGVVAATVRATYEHSVRVVGGILLGPILLYIVSVCFGLFNGLMTGGQTNIALLEIRTQFYILFAYLLAVNTGAIARQTARKSMALAAACIGFKGVLLTFRYFITLGGHTNPDQGVGAHEESFFFNEYVVLYLILKLGDLEPRMRRWMLIFLPFVVVANLANERRAATAAFMISIPVLFLLCYMAFPYRRKMILGIIGVTAALAAIYLPIFWNSDGIWGQPARAVRSLFDPSDRDQSSDVYRMAEDANLMYTMRSQPLFGYGYGKPIMITSPMVDLTADDPLILYLTHDQILWIWMRLGVVGFFFFWVMVSAFLMRSAAVAADSSFDSVSRAVGVFAAVTVSMLLIFGLLDMQLSNPRDVLFSCIWVGFVASLLREKQEHEDEMRIIDQNIKIRRPMPRYGESSPRRPTQGAAR